MYCKVISQNHPFIFFLKCTLALCLSVTLYMLNTISAMDLHTSNFISQTPTGFQIAFGCTLTYHDN